MIAPPSAAKVIERTDATTLKGYVVENVADDAKVYTDDAKAYKGLSQRQPITERLDTWLAVDTIIPESQSGRACQTTI